MIPADQFHDNGDGTAWWVKHKLWFNGAAADITDLDVPCETCGGVSLDLSSESIMETFLKRMDGAPAGSVGVRPCPDCIDGRHTFEVEVECLLCRERDLLGFTPPLGGCPRPSVRHVSIIPNMVLPIVAKGRDMVRTYASGCVLMTHHRETGDPLSLYVKVGSPIEVLTLPPAAAPDMLAVKVRIR